jgi:hypothetical protein
MRMRLACAARSTLRVREAALFVIAASEEAEPPPELELGDEAVLPPELLLLLDDAELEEARDPDDEGKALELPPFEPSDDVELE